jgi:Protein of unknown function (DUF4235)
MKVVYKPFGIALGILAALLGRRIFDFVWARLDDEEPPKPTIKEVSLAKLLVAAAIQGMIFRVVRVLVDRFGAEAWERLTGFWPGERRPERA